MHLLAPTSSTHLRFDAMQLATLRAIGECRGKHIGGRSVSYEELIEKVRSKDLLLIHDGAIEHDDVLFRDSFGRFEASDNLIELAETPPRWLGQLDNGIPIEIINSAITENLELTWDQS